MPKPLDYAERRNWIARPEKNAITKPVDVFWAYPTVYFHPDKKTHHLMPLSNPVFRTAARVTTWWHDRFLADTCNIFAPYYRQVGMEALWMTHAQFDDISRTPYEDIRDAFFYYLENCNDGRPFFLAGHSQGSEILIKLMSRDFGTLKEASRLIAAYLIGYSVTKDDLAKHPHLKMAESATDLGTIISYNTSAKGLKLMPVVLPGAVCVNPLNWSQGPEYAGKEENLGSVLAEFRHLVIQKKHFTGARIDEEKGVLMIDETALDEMLHMHIAPLNYLIIHRQSLHTLDIALFQRNLEHNVAVRTAEFFRENPAYAARCGTAACGAEAAPAYANI